MLGGEGGWFNITTSLMVIGGCRVAFATEKTQQLIIAVPFNWQLVNLIQNFYLKQCRYVSFLTVIFKLVEFWYISYLCHSLGKTLKNKTSSLKSCKKDANYGCKDKGNDDGKVVLRWIDWFLILLTDKQIDKGTFVIVELFLRLKKMIWSIHSWN